MHVEAFRMERSRENIESSHDAKIVSGLMTINICMYM